MLIIELLYLKDFEVIIGEEGIIIYYEVGG